MPNKQEVKTDTSTDQDKEQMRTLFLPALKRKLMLYIPIALLGICGIVFINLYDVRFDLDETKRGIGNVAFVFIAAFCLRLAISDIMNYNKDLHNFQVKTAKGIVKEASNKSITIASYEFSFPSKQADAYKAGDQVELRAAYKSNLIFRIRKI